VKRPEKEKSPFTIRDIRERHIYLILLIISAIASYCFISPGYPIAGDVWPHLVRTKFVYDWLKVGKFPFFSFFFYSGYPALRFYSPLLSILTGLLALPLGNIFWAMKLILFIANILSGFIFYWFLKEIGRDNFQSLLGAVVYLLVPWRTMYVAGIGTYPLALTFIFLPFSFLALERLLKNPSLRNSLLFGLTLSLSLLAHFIYALWSFLFLLLYFLLRRQFSLKILIYGLVSLLSGIINSAFFLLPFLTKFNSYSFPQVFNKLPPPNPFVLLGLRPEIGGYTGIYLGWSVILASGLGIYHLVKKRAWLSDGVTFGLFLSLFLTFLPGFLKKGEPIITAGLPPQRFLAFFIFFSGILITDGYSFLKEKLTNFLPARNTTFYLLFLIICFDCLPRTIYFPYETKEGVLGLREEIYEILKREAVTKLVDIDIPISGIDIFKRVCRYPAMGFLFGPFPTVYGPPYHQFAAKNMLYVYPWINSLAIDLGDSTTRELSDKSLKIIRLCGLSHIITLPTLLGGEVDQTVVVLKKGLIWDDRFILSERKPPLAIGQYPQNPLFLASLRIIPHRAESLIPERAFYIADDWEEILAKIEINHTAGNCNFIPAKETSLPVSLPGEEPIIEVEDFSITHDQITAVIYSSRDCFLRAAFSYYPEIKVLIDGQKTSVYETKDHFLFFPFPPGRHRVKIDIERPMDKYLITLSLLSIFGTVIIICLRFPAK